MVVIHTSLGDGVSKNGFAVLAEYLYFYLEDINKVISHALISCPKLSPIEAHHRYYKRRHPFYSFFFSPLQSRDLQGVAPTRTTDFHDYELSWLCSRFCG